MLKLVLGRQKTGKTYYCLDAVRNAVDNGEDVILLIPEQSSFAMQRLTLDTYGPKISNKISIHSFTSLCEAICSVCGGISGIEIDESIRFMLVSEAVKSVRDNLKLYTKYIDSTPFIKQIMSVITELKQSNVPSERLIEISKTYDGMLADKLNDISLIFSAYNSLLKNRFLDPLDLIENTVLKMGDNSVFSGKTVVVDDFKGFTVAQFRMLERIISGSKDVIVTLCTDKLLPENGTEVFANVKDSASRLIQIAQNHAVKVAEPVVLDKIFAGCDELKALDGLLSESSVIQYSEDAPNITVCEAETSADEIDFCFNNIRRLVREEGYRYRDFVIIARNDNGYSDIIDDISKTYDIPVLVDRRISVLNLPLTVFTLKAVKSVLRFDTESILSLVKTGLLGLSEEEASILENYTYIWSIDGNKWLEEWTMSTQGLNPDLRNESKIKAEAERLERVNSIKFRVIEPLKALKNSLKGNAENMCRALLSFFDRCNVLHTLSRYTDTLESNGKLQEAEYQRAGYDVLIKIFDKLIAVLGEREISVEELCEMLNVTFGYETVGEIPQTQDEVVFGTADRIRPVRPKAVFVIGANQDVFPATVSDSGLLTQNDREVLNSNDLRLSDHYIKDCVDEKFLFYFALTCADEKVLISYSKSNALGSPLEASVEVSAIEKAFENANKVHYGRSFSVHSAETKEQAFRRLAEHFNDDNSDIYGLKAYFGNDKTYSKRLKAIEDFIADKKLSISNESAEKLYGRDIQLSPSKADCFAGCKFLYFCKYGLNAGKLEKADFNPITRGNVVHYCLEHFVNSHLNNIGKIADDEIEAEIENLSLQYLSENNTDISKLDEKFSYLFRFVVNTAVYLAQCLNREFSVSSYSPKFCELDIGDGEQVKGIDVLTDDGKRVTLRGTVDRVDTTADGKVRVVDYKTGSKGDGLKLSELIDGQNMQMLLYLYALVKNGQDLIKASRPTAVLYFPAKREYSATPSDYVKMHGIVVEDPEIVKEMEPDGKGKIAPVTLYPNGTAFYKSDSLVSEEAFGVLFKYLELLLRKIGNSLTSGDISPEPLQYNDKLRCEFCDYRSICRADVYRLSRESTDCKRDEALEMIKRELEGTDNGN